MKTTRQTRRVKAVIEVFDEEKKAISVVDLIKLLESQMNKTTVYRILNKLMEDGILHSFIDRGGLKWYAKCQGCSRDTHNDVHPHFQCRKCGEVKCLSVTFTIPTIDDYKIDSINFLMIGKCSNCS